MNEAIMVPPVVRDPRRLDALADYGILDTAPEKGFDDIVTLARRLCDAPVALVSLVDRDRQWFKARAGFEACETSLDRSVCAHALAEPGMLVIPDLTLDPRTRDNPLVTEEPRLRFYAGAPLETPDGRRLGSLCVIDTRPRPEGLTDEQEESLRALAGQVMAQMELRRAAAERGRVVAGQEILIAQQNALLATQTRVAGAAGDMDAVLDALVAGVMAAVPAAEGGAVELREGEEVVYRSARGTLAGHVGLRLPLTGSLAGHCLLTGRSVLCPDARLDPRVNRDAAGRLGLRSALCVPVARGGAPVGVLKLQSGRVDAFAGRDLRTARQFAATVAAGLAQVGEAEARRDVRAGEATLRTVLDTLPVGVLIAEAPSGRIVGGNARVGDILGRDVRPTDPDAGTDLWTGRYEDGTPVAPADWPLARVIREGVPGAGLEVEYLRGDGGRAWLDFAAAPMRDPGGRVTGGVVVVTDIDARKRSERQLAAAKAAAEQANRAKSEFLANMSHELRTPLAAVIGYSELVREELEAAGAADLIPDMQKIEANARHLLGLISDVLDISKIEAERMETHAEAFTVEDLVRDVVATAEPLVARNGNALLLDVAPSLGAAHTDTLKLRQCLVNLLGNAAKFTREGTVTLGAAREAADGVERLVFRVADTGIGMSAEQRARLFERFVQADGSTTRRFGGTGLGLAITRAFARMLGGAVEVASIEGVGSTFTLAVPVLLPAEAEVTDPGGGHPQATDPVPG